MEMALRCPDRLKAMLIRKLCALEAQSVSLIFLLRVAACEIEEAEIEILFSRSRRGLRCGAVSLIRQQNDFYSLQHCPEQFQHGDVKRDAGQCQDRIFFVTFHPLVHAAK